MNLYSNNTLLICLSVSFGLWVGSAVPADLILTIRTDVTYQTIDNFGTSAAFELNEITDDWDESNLDLLADMLFSTEINADGSLKGIGLTGFRVEIGAGSIDQGNDSRISRRTARTKCPLRSDGSYDWSQMEAELYWARKAHEYGIQTLIGYSNSPPIYLTINGLACRTSEVPSVNLREDAYDDFAEYLARVAAHFESVNTPLHYISPVNEPQWDWLCSTQEGSQWRTDEIRDIVVAMQSAFSDHNVSTKALITEAGALDWIYNNSNNNALTGQLRYWDESDPLYIGDLSVLAPVIAGHSYWTEDTDNRLYTIRRDLANAVGQTDVPINWWQTEYSFMGEGYQDLSPNPTNHELGLFMAKVIYADLTVGNAAVWQFWETFDSTTDLPRYRLVRVDRRQQTASPEKTYWALGHYSRFIRPGMRRVQVERSDNLNPSETLRNSMPTAFIDPATGNITIVLVNYLNSEQIVHVQVPGAPDTTTVTPYLSTSQLDMRRQETFTLDTPFALPARSIVTLTLGSNIEISIKPHRHDREKRSIQIYREPGRILVRFAQAGSNTAVLLNARGEVILNQNAIGRGISLCTKGLASGIYLLNAQSGTSPSPPKLIFIN